MKKVIKYTALGTLVYTPFLLVGLVLMYKFPILITIVVGIMLGFFTLLRMIMGI